MRKRISLVIFLSLFTFNLSANSEQKCLAEAIYHEARGEPLLGKLAVAQVVINRTKNKAYPQTICGVVYQKNQFTNIVPRFNIDSMKVAALALSGKHQLANFSAIYFHNHKVKPRWKNVVFVKTIGRHTFYKASYEQQTS